jgi:hypothetical protein
MISTMLLVFLTGCTKEPAAQEIEQFLRSQLPEEAPYSLSSVKTETKKTDDRTYTVNFKADLKLDKPLYRQVDTERALRESGWQEGGFLQAGADLQNLPRDVSEQIMKTHAAAVETPVLLQRTAAVGETKSWYGSIDATHLVDKWSFSKAVTQERTNFIGEPREKFGPRTYVQGEAEADAALTVARNARIAFVSAVATNMQLTLERRNRELAERRAEELIVAQQQAAATAEAAKRRLPIELRLRKSSFREAQNVILIKNSSGTALSVDVLMSNGQLEKRFHFDLPAGRPVEIGWLQGWPVRSGDTVTIRNLSYDPMNVRVP